MSESRRLFVGDLSKGYPAVDVGQFTLEKPIGRGSMGEVWRARHTDQDIDVAIKVIAPEQAVDQRSHRAFRQEVRSMAELNHPFIIDVHDYGTIDEEAASDSLGELQAGSPYLVMEYAVHGSLGGRVEDRVDWEVARLIVLSVLDALAHSHARGVLHRDVKPQNILLASLEDGPGIKLTDYGLAYALRQNQEVANWHRAAGTPEYMAPEQVTGDWRRYGPFTDLYAVGCVAYELLTGHPPFRGGNIVQIARAHIEDSMPPLPNDVDAPQGIDNWLCSLLAKEPGDRFATAAEAAYTLRKIDDTPFDETHLRRTWKRLISFVDKDFSADESAWANTTIAPTHSLDVLIHQSDPEGATSDRQAGDTKVVQHIPEHWGRGERSGSPPRLIGAGRGLFEMRRLPVFGRSDERNHLWTKFRRCANDGEITATLLTGPSGVGKTCLARWLCDRVSELGVAQVFRTHHEATEEIIDQLATTLRRKYSLTGLDRQQIEDFFRSMLQELGAQDSYEWEALADLIHVGDDPTAHSKFHFATSTQRYMVYVRFFERLSQRGPVLLWLNDVQWGLPALQFVETLVNHPTLQAPIYVVMTGRDDLLSDSSSHKKRVDTILDHRRADKLEIEPLDEQTLRRLVKKALFVDPSAAYEVTRRAGGNPRHALAIVGDWIEGDLLEADRHGYTLREEAELDTPGDWTELWSRVVDRLTGGCDDTRRLLEAGAALGERFRRQVWETAAEMMGLTLPEDLVETLLNQKYITPVEQDLAFTQNWLREALFSSSRERSRWEEICLVSARALDQCASSMAAVDERVGFLLLEAGRPIEGSKRLLSALEDHFESREYQAMIHLSRRGLQALENCGVHKAKRLRIKLLIHLAHGWHNVGANDRCRKCARQAASLAEELGDDKWRGIASRPLAASLYITGDVEAAKTEHEITEKYLADNPEFADVYAQGLLGRAHIAIMEDDYDRAIEDIERARRAIADIDAPVVATQVEYVRMKAQLLRGNWDNVDIPEVESLLQRCLDAGTTMGAAHTANVGGELTRRHGDLDEARRWYRKSLELFRLVEPDLIWLPRQNLALVALEEGRLAVAGHRAERVLQQMRRIDRPQIELAAMAVKLPMLVVQDNIADLRSHLDRMDSIIERLGYGSDRDIALGLRIARQNLQEKTGHKALIERIESLLTRVEP